jgi:hypothetical protein
MHLNLYGSFDLDNGPIRWLQLKIYCADLFGLIFKIEKILIEGSFQLNRYGKESKSIKKANHFFFPSFDLNP